MSNRFVVKSNFGHWNVFDSETKTIVVGYSLKKYAQQTADGLNRIKTARGLKARIKSLATNKGYGYYVRKGKK